MRRGELLGLRWSDLDLDAWAGPTIRQTMTMVGDRPEVGTPKSRAGSLVIASTPATVVALRAWRTAQVGERLVDGRRAGRVHTISS